MTLKKFDFFNLKRFFGIWGLLNVYIGFCRENKNMLTSRRWKGILIY